MAAQKIDKSKWQAFFDRLSRGLIGMRAEIEVASLALGDQIEAEWLPLLGIAYDPKDNVLEIALEGLDHLIRRSLKLRGDRRRRRLPDHQAVRTFDAACAGAGIMMATVSADDEGCSIYPARR
jgi:hypothetical protein